MAIVVSITPVGATRNTATFEVRVSQGESEILEYNWHWTEKDVSVPEPKPITYGSGLSKRVTLTGLPYGSTIRAWVRVRTKTGWFSWAGPAKIETYDPPAKPLPVIVSNVKQMSATASARPNYAEPIPVLEYRWTLYMYNATLSSWSKATEAAGIEYVAEIGGLTPGVNYAITAKYRNNSGWGPESDMVVFKTIGGAWVLYQGSWREAIPYVKYQGTWRMTTPMFRIDGSWREVIQQ